MIAGLADGSVCPTLTCKVLRFGWGRRFRLPTDCFTASEPEGAGAFSMRSHSRLSFEPRPALRRKRYLALIDCVSTLDNLDKALHQSILPNRMPRTCAAPSLHCFRISPGTS